MNITRLVFLFAVIIGAVSSSYAQPHIDWVHHLSSEDTTSSRIPFITDADVDINGNLIITGVIQEAYDLDSDREEDISLSGEFDLFVASYSKEGRLNWARTAGSDNKSMGLALTSDEEANVYVTGQGTQISDIDQEGFPDISADSSISFLIKYDSFGDFQWIQVHEKPMSFPAQMLYNDQRQEVLVSGADYSLCEQSTEQEDCGSYLSQFNLVSYSTDGRLNWSRKGNTMPDDSLSYIDIQHLSLAKNGAIQIGGLIRGRVDIDHTDFAPPLSGTRNYFSRGNPYKAILSKEGAVTNQEVFDLPLRVLPGFAINPDGTLYLNTGSVQGSPETGSLPSGHVLHFNTRQSEHWGHIFSSADSPSSSIFTQKIDTDTASNLYLSGNVSGTVDLDSDGIDDITQAEATQHAFFAKYSPTGNLEWVFHFDHEPSTNSSSQGQWIVTRDGSSIYAIAVFQGIADPDGSESLSPISATGTGSGMADILIVHITAPLTNTNIDEAITPIVHGLSTAYPNPFVDKTSFTLQVHQTQRINIRVYNALGQHIKTLYDGHALSNEKKIFHLESESLPSGLYILHVEGEHFNQTQKVLKVK